MTKRLDGAPLAMGDLATLDRVVGEHASGVGRRLSLAMRVFESGAELSLTLNAGPNTPSVWLQADAPAPVVRAVLAWAQPMASSVLVNLHPRAATPDFAVAARIVLDVLAATPAGVVVIDGTPQSERGEIPEYGQPSVVLQLAGGLACTLVGGLVPAGDCAAATADYRVRAQALAAALGVPISTQ